MNKKFVLPAILLALMSSLVGLTVGRLALSYGSASWSEAVVIEGQVSVQELATCVQPVDYWRAHSACSTNPERSTAWDAIGEETPFYQTGQTWCEVLWQDPADPVIHAEQQYIAARLNEAAGVPAPVAVRNAVAAIHGWLDASNPQPYEAIAPAVAELMDYHSGALFPYRCEPTDNSGTYLPPNEAPAGAEDHYELEAGALIAVMAPGVLGNDSDPDLNPLTASVVELPQHGSLDLHEDGSFTYQPNDGYDGPDSFSYSVSDGTDSAGPVRVTLTVLPASDDDPTPTATPLSDNLDERSETDSGEAGTASPTPTETTAAPTPTPTPIPEGEEGHPADPTSTGTPVDEPSEEETPGSEVSPIPTEKGTDTGQSGEVEEPLQTPEASRQP